jgi:hypothetical protein
MQPAKGIKQKIRQQKLRSVHLQGTLKQKNVKQMGIIHGLGEF